MPLLLSKIGDTGPRMCQGIQSIDIFMNKDVLYVGMLEAKIDDGKPFRIFFFKDPYYVMKIM